MSGIEKKLLDKLSGKWYSLDRRKRFTFKGREKMSYNGWSNKETWAVNIWVGNNQELQEHFLEVTIRAWEASSDSIGSRSTQARYTLQDQIKDWMEENQPETEGLWADLLGAALSSVDYYEIADIWLRDAEIDGYERLERYDQVS